MSLHDLQEALPRWVRLERHHGQPVVSHPQGAIAVTEVMDFPEAPPNAVRADVHFVVVAPTEGFPTREELLATVAGALGSGVFMDANADTLAQGPSYISLGGWLGSQDLALMFIGAVELAGIARAVTPERLGLTGSLADQAAGNGLVMLGPSRVWCE